MKPFEVKNAVLRKDMILDMKRPKIMIIMIIFNLILGCVLLPVLIAFPIVGLAAGEISYKVMVYFFIALVWIECIAIIFLAPALTAGCISIEKERQTLEVLLTTSMTPWQIVTGKYLSAIYLVIMLIISSIPTLFTVFIYGGISIWQMLQILAILVTTTFFIASFGVFFSAMLKNTILSVILTYITVGAVLSITFMLAFGGMGVTALVNEMITDYMYDVYYIKVENVLCGDPFIFILWLNPLVTLFDGVGQVFGYADAGNGIADLPIYTHFTDKNILLNMWTILSIVSQGLVTFLLLKASAFFLKPVKKQKKGKKAKKTQKAITA
ncbi:MAG: ABC transporter permease subunit [Lachnospiraceae bacterium]|nr:ABC transporter permease subunit [Lachnospiraceae bacterium]